MSPRRNSQPSSLSARGFLDQALIAAVFGAILTLTLMPHGALRALAGVTPSHSQLEVR